jgi:LysM domain-containing protein
VQEDPATTQAPRITDLDDAHVGRDLVDAVQPTAIDGDRSPNAWVCPFLRATDDDRRLRPPLEVPDAVNRCAALHDPVPQSLRQQELVCLTSGHVNCPRYLRGSLLPAADLGPVGQTRVVTPAIAGSVAILIIAFLLSLAFVVANGGLTLTAVVAPSPSGIVLAEAPSVAPSHVPTQTPTSTPVPSATPDPTPTATPLPTAKPVPSHTPEPTATPAPSATPKPAKAPTAALPPGATASRMRLVTRCPDRTKCYIYRIRSGDNLYSIANYFGVSLATVRAWNTWTENGLRVGRELRIPPPTN